jgi:urease accessory protein
MALGGALGFAGVGLPLVEVMIAASIIVLGAAVALRASLPTLAAMALVGFFAIFHGHAHGGEMPADVAATGYAAGFMLATALLHGLGIGFGLLIGRASAVSGERLVRAGGGAAALAGLAILAGLL